MPFDITERDVEVAAAVIAASRMIEAPQLPAPSWHGLARHILEEVERDRKRQIESMSNHELYLKAFPNGVDASGSIR